MGLGRGRGGRYPGVSATCSPRGELGKSSLAQPLQARAAPWVPTRRWRWLLCGHTVPAPPRPAPAQNGPRAAPRARRRRTQNSTVRLGRRAAVAPPLRPLVPARAPSESVCLSCPPSPFAPSSPSFLVFLPGCRAQTRVPPSSKLESVSLAAAAGEAAAARGASRQPQRFFGSSEHPAWLPLGLFLPRLGAPRAQTPARFSQ